MAVKLENLSSPPTVAPYRSSLSSKTHLETLKLGENDKRREFSLIFLILFYFSAYRFQKNLSKTKQKKLIRKKKSKNGNKGIVYKPRDKLTESMLDALRTVKLLSVEKGLFFLKENLQQCKNSLKPVYIRTTSLIAS